MYYEDILAAGYLSRIDDINKHFIILLSLLPPLRPAQDVGDVDEGQHDALLLHLGLLGQPKVVGATHPQAGLSQESDEEEADLGDDILPAAVLRQLLVQAPSHLVLDDGEEVPVAVEVEGGGDGGEDEDERIEDPHHSRVQIL